MKALTPPRLMIAAAAALSVLPSCRKSAQAQADSEWWELETKRVKLVHKMEVVQMRQSKIDTARQEHDAVNAEWAQTVEYRSDLEEYAGRLREEVAQYEEQLVAIRTEWVQKTRAAVAGRTFDTLAGTDGRAFKQVVITRVTDVGVEFRHATGTARLAADQLKADQREAFALDTALAHEAIEEENALAADFASWVDEGVAAAADREDARQQMLMAEYDKPASPPVSPAPLEAAPRTSSALREEARPFGNGGSIWSPYYSRGYRTRYYYVPSRSCYSAPSPYRSSSTPSARSTPRNWSYTPR